MPEPRSAEARLRASMPWVPWDEPLGAGLFDGSAEGLACRYCIAMYGMKGSDITDLPQTPEEFRRHLSTQHGREPATERSST